MNLYEHLKINSMRFSAYIFFININDILCLFSFMYICIGTFINVNCAYNNHVIHDRMFLADVIIASVCLLVSSNRD